MKKLLKLLAFLAVLLAATPARAQFIGYTSPQTVNASPFSAASCVGTVSSGNLPSLGQTVHAIAWSISGSPTPTQITIQGSNDGVSYFQISDSGTASIGILTASGYYPAVRVQINGGGTGCVATVTYAGTSVTPSAPIGQNDISVYRKVLDTNQAAGSDSGSQQFLPPYGNTYGELIFSYTGGSGPTGSTLTVQCVESNPSVTYNAGTFTVQNFNAMPQIIEVPPMGCDALQVNYAHGGTSSSTFSLTYYFAKPGASLDPLCNSVAIINVAAAGPTQVIAAGNGQSIRVCSIDISSGTAEAIDLQQGSGSNCATGNSQLTGLAHLAANAPFSRTYPRAGLIALNSNAVCVHLSGANQTDGTITYSQF